MKSAVLLSLPLLLFAVQSAYAFGRKAAYETPCPQVRILRAEGSIDFTDAETRLICGDSEDDRIGKAWKNVPISQAKRNFRNFLQDRGYFKPVFQERPEVGDGIIEFDPGPRSHIQSITAPGAPPEVQISKYRFARGQPMTPKRVSEVRDWYRKRLMEEGYPCPELEGRGDPETGEVQVLWLNPSPVAQVSTVNGDESIGLATGTLRRYDALSVGQPFSLVRTEISGRRATGSRLVLADDLEPVCPLTAPAQVSIKETTQVGPPRLVSFAVGANTESLVLGKASWSHTRLGRAGSNVDFSARGSFKEQSARARGDWYFQGGPSPQRLSPFIQLAHENEQRFQLIGIRSAALWKTSAETLRGMFTLGGGLGWRSLRQLEGIGPDHYQFPTFQAEAAFVSHDFEYYASSPRSGGRASLTATLAGDGVINAGHPLQFKLDSTWLSNPGGFDPPWVVLGVRATASATFLPTSTHTSDIPVDFRQWVGGGNDIRGYGRLELPNNDFGGRYTFTLGTEVRFPYTLPFKIEPFLLADFGLMRSGPAANAESTLGVWSPGFGLRCESPIGPIRASVAHGYVINGNGPEHWQIFLGLGEEF